MTVRLFARLRELVGTGEMEWEVGGGSTVDDLWRDLAFRHEGLDAFGRSVTPAVNGELARRGTPLSEGDEVAFLPPVSGGAR